MATPKKQPWYISLCFHRLEDEIKWLERRLKSSQKKLAKQKSSKA